MLNIATILKVLGVKVTSEQVAALEIIIPQIPERAKEIITSVNTMIAMNETRMRALEMAAAAARQNQEAVLMKLDAMWDVLDVLCAQTYRDENIRQAGHGAAGKLLEMRRESSELTASSPGLPDSLEAADAVRLDSVEASNVDGTCEIGVRRSQL